MFKLKFSRFEELFYFILIFHVITQQISVFNAYRYLYLEKMSFLLGNYSEANLFILPETMKTILIFIILSFFIKFFMVVICCYLLKKNLGFILNLTKKQFFCFIICIYFMFILFGAFIVVNKLFLINLIFHPELNEKLKLNLWGYWKFIFQVITFPPSRFASDPWTAIVALFTSVSRDPLFICIFAFGIRFLNKGEFYIYTGEMLQKLNIMKNKTLHFNGENLIEGTGNDLNERYTNSQIEVNKLKAQAILVRKNDEELLIHCDDIFSVEAAGNYMNLDNGQEIFSIYTTTEGILSQLPHNFKKIHRSSIINFDKVVNIRSESAKNKMTVTLENDTQYLVARSYQKLVKSYFKNMSLINKS